jgi:hypothetical protein
MITACPWPWKLSNSRLAQGGAVFGGGKGGSGGTTYQTQQTTIPPEVRARYDAVNARAEQVAQTPFQPYQGEFVAPINQTQQQGINQIAAAGGGYQPYQQAATAALTGAAETALPYYGAAGNALQAGAGAATPYFGLAGQNIGQAQAAGAPYTGAATLAGLAGTQAVNPADLQIGRYMDPYLQSVVEPTMQGLRQQQQQEQSQLMGAQAMRGAFGGDRGSIAAANLARQQGLASAQAQAGLLSQGYGQALQTAQQQQGVGLGAAQANRQAFQNFAPQLLQIGQQAFQQPLQAAQAQQGLGQGYFGLGQGMAQGQMGIGQGLLGYGQGVAGSLAGLGQQGTQTGLAAGQALLGAGTLQQQTQQQLNSALYNQYLQQQGYPFQVAQFLANIALGTGPLYGSTTTGVTGQPTPFFSDERLKTDITEIGRTHDGQKIIKFRYHGEPPGTSHIGLSAQDVEKHHPEAVSETPEGVKAVDYDAATKHAERAYGGMAAEGGAVHPGLAGLGFAMGGVPVPGANPTTEQMKLGLAPRRGFATSGAVTPGIDDQSRAILQQLANPLGGTTPHGSFGTMPGKPGAWSPKLAAPQRSSILGADKSLPPPPAPGKTGLGQAMDTVQGVGSAINTGETLYKGGKKAVDWIRENTKPYSNVGELIEKQGLGSDQPATSAPQTQAAAPAPGLGGGPQVGEAATGLAPETATAALETVPTEELAGLGEGLGGLSEGMEALSMFAARGGRIHRAPGGRMGYATSGGIKTDLPFNEAQGEFVPEQLTETEPTSKLDEPKMQMGQQGKGQGQQKDHLAGAAKGAMSGASMGSIFGPWGMAGGAILGGLAGGMARGGSADVERAKQLISRVESGGRYDALGPTVRGDRAHGKYQIMGANIPSWTEEALGRRMTPEEFLKSPEAQERTFEHRFGKYLAQHGTMEDAASMWHSGMPLSEARRHGARDVNMSTEDYVRKVLGGAPVAETRMASAEEGPSWTRPRGGLAPTISDVEELPEDDILPKFEHFDRARGGLVPRNGYQVGGIPQSIDPDSVGLVPPQTPDDPAVDPAKLAIMREQQQRAGVAPPDVVHNTTLANQPPPTERPITPRDNRTEGDRDMNGYNPPAPQPGLGPTQPADDRSFFQRAGDWYDKNQNWVLPLVSGIGSTFASRSPYLLNAVGEGLASGADKALSASFKQQQLGQSQQRVNVETAQAIQNQIWEAQAQRINVLKNDSKADVTPYNNIIERLTRKLYDLYGVPGEGLKMSTPQRSSGVFGQLHPSQDIGFMYQQLGGAPPEERARISRQIAEVQQKIVEGKPLMLPDGSAFYPDENFKKALEAEASRLHVQASAPAGGLGSAERDNINTQLVTLQQDRNAIRTRLQEAASGNQAVLQKIAEVQQSGADPTAAGLPPQIVRMIQQIRSIYNQESALREQLQSGQGTPPRRPGQTRAYGGRAGYQYGGGPLDPRDPEALAKEITDPLTAEPQRQRFEKQYGEATPEQTTPAGTKYRINPIGGAVPKEEPPLAPPTPGTIEERTGRVVTSAPALPYATTGGFPTDPNLPKQPYTLMGTDAYSGTARETSATAEKAFLDAATSQQADNNIMTLLKIANAMKVLETGGLTSRRADIANTLRGLGFEGAAQTVMSNPDMNQAYIATKAALDEAIRKSGAAFDRVTQGEFKQVAGQGAPSVDLPGGANIALLKESMAQQLWQNALREDWIKARDEGGARNFTAFTERWRQAHPPELFRQSADRLLGNVSGTSLQAPSKLTEGVVYVVPKDLKGHPLAEELGRRGLRPGDLFTMTGIEHGRDPESGKMKFNWQSIEPVSVDKGYETHMRAPGLRRGRP